MYGYDFAWILQLINECNKKKMPTFKGLCFDGVSDYRRYLLDLGIEGVPTVKVLDEYYNLIKEGKFPNWRFKDEPEFNEHNQDKHQRRHCSPSDRLRRINIVRRFLKIFLQYICLLKCRLCCES